MGFLPTERSKPKTGLSEFVTLVYGPPKAGKTTFAAGFPDAVFLATEEGQNALEVAKVAIDSWEKFISVCAELAQGGHPYKTVVIDTVDNLWHLCRLNLLEKKGLEYENDGNYAYGKGSSIILTEFRRVITKLAMLPYGLVLISHANKDEVVERTATNEAKYHRWTPNLPDKVAAIVTGMADFILFAEQTANVRGELTAIIHTRPMRSYIAGARVSLPDPIPLDYQEFAAAFNAAMLERGVTPKPTQVARPAGSSHGKQIVPNASTQKSQPTQAQTQAPAKTTQTEAAQATGKEA